jgi:hypothetical protein
MEPGAQPVAIDRTTLTPVVRRAIGRATAEVAAWDVRPLGGAANPVTGTLRRVRGTAHDGGAPVPWSVVLKECNDPGQDEHHDPRSQDYWKREFLVYASGLLEDLPPGVRAPRCYGTQEHADRTAWLWLEDVTDAHAGPWPVERYALAARHAGQFNGAYLAGRPIPDRPWLSIGIARSFFEWLGPQLERVGEFRDHPLVRREWPDPALLDRSLRLWREREAFYAALARLPRTLAHLDLARCNLFAARGPDGADETVAIDWAFTGTAAVGEELAALACASAFLLREHADRVRELGETCFEGYLTGLRDAGWRDDARLARLGYAAGLIRYAGTITPSAIGDPAVMAWLEGAWGPYPATVDRWMGARRYILDLADEARQLMPSL